MSSEPRDKLVRRAAVWRRLHRRSVLGALLIMGLVVLPFLTLITWINWAIIFRGRNWSLDLSHPGIPEAAAGLLALLGFALFCRSLVAWSVGRGAFWRGDQGPSSEL